MATSCRRLWLALRAVPAPAAAGQIVKYASTSAVCSSPGILGPDTGVRRYPCHHHHRTEPVRHQRLNSSILMIITKIVILIPLIQSVWLGPSKVLARHGASRSDSNRLPSPCSLWARGLHAGCVYRARSLGVCGSRPRCATASRVRRRGDHHRAIGSLSPCLSPCLSPLTRLPTSS